MTFKEHTISFIKTFLATFITVFVGALLALPNETLLQADFWQSGAVIALVLSAVRSAIASIWGNVMPPKLGGYVK
jgi:hypothetical protein